MTPSIASAADLTIGWCKKLAIATTTVCVCAERRSSAVYNLLVHSMAAVRGLYRVPGWAYATDGVIAFDMREELYRANGCQPDYDDLPTKRTYEAAKKKGAKVTKIRNKDSTGT
jgi:hypothetical protein